MPSQLNINALRILDANGNPVAGAKVTFFETGSSTPLTVYTDSSLATAHPSPLPADAAGVLPQVWTNGATDAKVQAVTSAGASVPGYPMDPVPMVSATGAAASSVSFSPVTGNSATNVQAAIETLTTANNTALDLGDTSPYASAAQGTKADNAAPLASPALTGTPTAPTAADGTNSTQIATTAFVVSQSGFVMIGAPVVISSSTASVAFTDTDASRFSAYGAIISNLLGTSDGTHIQLRVSNDGGSSYHSTGYLGHANASGTPTTSTAGGVIGNGIGTASGESGYSGQFTIFNPHNASTKTHMAAQGMSNWYSDGLVYSVTGAGIYDTAEANDAFQISMNSGSIASATIQWFGIVKGIA